MNQQWTDAENWVDLIDHIWIGVVLIVVAAVPSWMAHRNNREIKAVGKQTTEVVGQVVNGHAETNLRNDLDRVIAAVESLGETVRDMCHDVRSLRSDLMAEEDRRRIQIGDLRDELEHRTGKRRNL